MHGNPWGQGTLPAWHHRRPMSSPSPVAEVSPRVPLRRSLLLSASALVLASLAAFVVSLYAFVYRPLAQDVAAGQRARYLSWSAAGKLEKEENREVDYDARERPWFQGAMALSSEEDVHWTSPYLFRSTHEPGLSLAVRWTAPDGRYAMGSDLT